MELVGFFDILGTRDAVMADRFEDVDVREFVNAIGIAAHICPSIRFVVFSDSLIFSAKTTEASAVLRAVNCMYANWFSELIYVRGAISCGEVNWIASFADDFFSKLPNFTYARVYGKGLVIAHELEQRSGPGAVCFLTDSAATIFRATEPTAVLDGLTPMLSWATESQAKGFDGYAQNHLRRSNNDSAEWRHANATKNYWSLVVDSKKFLPKKYDSQAMS